MLVTLFYFLMGLVPLRNVATVNSMLGKVDARLGFGVVITFYYS